MAKGIILHHWRYFTFFISEDNFLKTIMFSCQFLYKTNFVRCTHLLIDNYHNPDLLHKWPLLQVCYRPLCRSSHFQQTLNNFVSPDFFFTKLSMIDPCEKHENILGGQHWRNFLWLVANL